MRKAAHAHERHDEGSMGGRAHVLERHCSVEFMKHVLPRLLHEARVQARRKRSHGAGQGERGLRVARRSFRRQASEQRAVVAVVATT